MQHSANGDNLNNKLYLSYWSGDNSIVKRTFLAWLNQCWNGTYENVD